MTTEKFSFWTIFCDFLSYRLAELEFIYGGYKFTSIEVKD